MSFLSLKFALFAALGLLLFHNSSARWRRPILLGISFAFYATWSIWHAVLLLLVTGAVYYAARLIEQTPAHKTKLRWVLMSVTAVLVLLTVFKCGQFLADAIQAHLRTGTIDAALLLIAPLGLSYYLFKLLGYLLDVYWEKLAAQRKFSDLALYAMFFPQLVCGPIQRADDFFAQLENIGVSHPETFVHGLRRILFGLFKKVVIADQLAFIVTRLHGNPQDYSSLELLLGAYCFSLQMYADFSGITDIAIGIGQLFGIKGPENFNQPYFAKNIQEFWRRWHMSLTSWLGDYLFLPLRMALRRLGDVGLVVALFVNMIAIAMWHGPRWSYFVFGCVNGLFVTVSVLTLKQRNNYFRKHAWLSEWRKFGAPLLTFHLVVFTHIFFQAADLSSAWVYLKQLLHLAPSATIDPMRLDWSLIGLSRLRFAFALAGLMLVEAVRWGAKQPVWTARYTASPRFVRWGVSYALAVLVILSARGTTSFIYAQF